MKFHGPRPRRQRVRSTSPLVNNALRLCGDTARWYLLARQASAQPRSAPVAQAAPAAPAARRVRVRTLPVLMAVPVLGLALVLPFVQPGTKGTPVTQAVWPAEQSATIEAATHRSFAVITDPCREADILRQTITDGCQPFEVAEELVSEPPVLLAWEEPELEEVVDAALPAPEPVAVAAPVSAAGLSWPALGRITSVLGPAHPMGLDIALDAGQPVASAGDGRVAFAGWSDDYGNFVLINHPGGYTTRYAHFMRPPSVRTGEQVRRGQVIGLAGSTGRSDGPHLHFEVHLRNLLVDPLKYLPRIALVYDLSAYRVPSPSATPTLTPTTVPAVWEATTVAINTASAATTGTSTPAPVATATNPPALTPPTRTPAVARTATATVVIPAPTPTSTRTPMATPTSASTPSPATPTPAPTPTPTPPPPPAPSIDNPGSTLPPPN